MTDAKSPINYSTAQKTLHWLMAAAIIADLFIAQKFGGVMENWDRFESRSDHASLGTLVAILFVIRLTLRVKHGAPPLPSDLPDWQRRLAQFAHVGFYGLIGVLLASGIASAMTADSQVTPFGLFAYGDGNGNPALFAFIRGVHEWATTLLIGLIALHVAAALLHLASRDHRQLTLRMMGFGKGGSPQ